MKTLKAFSLLLILHLIMIEPLEAQDNIRGKPRLFETWILTDQLPEFQKRGVLYEVKDSSIQISDSYFKKDYQTGHFRTSEYDFRRIESLKLRKVNSIRNGVVIGSSIGFGLAIAGFFLLTDPGDFEGLAIPALLVYGTGTAAIGGGIGLLASVIKTTIPLERNYENFSRNRARLQNYAVMKKSDYGVIDHQSYLGLWQIGPSFATGGFTDQTTEHYAKKTGYGGDICNLGFLFRPKFGISISGFNQEYDVADDNQEMCWMFTGLVAGPLFAFPAGSKCRFDLKPRIGSADVTFYVDENEQTSVSGFVLNPCVTFRFNFARRWSLISETGFYNIKTKYELYGQSKYQAFNLNAGIAYRFR